MNFGNKQVISLNIRKYMKECGITQKDLSRSLDVPYTTVLSWTNAKFYPRIDKIEKMAELFGCTKSDLIEDKSGEKKEPGDDAGQSEVKRDLIEVVNSMSESEAAVLLASLRSALRKH